MNTIQLTETVPANAPKDYAKIKAFKSIGIDSCCDDNKMPSEAIVGARATREKMIAPLKQVSSKRPPSSQEFNRWKLDSMIDYIISTHHQYAKENAVIIYALAQKVAHHHGKNHPELTQLTTTMFLLLHDLLNSMIKEEQILFPKIRHLIKNKGRSGKSEHTTFGLIKEWIRLVGKKHQASAKNIELFHDLTNGYTLPEDACHSYKFLFEKMKEFQDDLLMHVHLENNILFPKALARMRSLTKMVSQTQIEKK